MAIPRTPRFQNVYEPEDDFGADEAFLRNVVAPTPAPVAAPAPPPAPIAAPAPDLTPAVVPEVNGLPDFSNMVNPFTGETFGSVDYAPLLKQAEEAQAKEKLISDLTGQLSSQWQEYGLDPSIKGINRANELAQILAHYGITDLSQFGLKQTPYEEQVNVGGGGENAQDIWETRKGTRGQLTYGDKTYGHLIGFGGKGQQEFLTRDPFEYLQDYGDQGYKLAGSAAGKGAVDYILLKDAQGNLRKDAQGRPVLIPQWRSTSDVTPELIQFLSIAAMPFTGGLSGALGGGLAGQIGAQALISGGLGGLGSAAQGGDFLSGFGKGALTGGITGGISSLAAPFAQSIGADVLSSTGSQTLSDAVTGAIKGGAGALPAGLISGDFSNVLSSALTGGATAAATTGLSDITGLSPKDVNAAIRAAQAIGSDNPLALANIASAYLPGPDMPGVIKDADIEEDFFAYGKPGFMPTEELSPEEVDRELRGLLARYPAPAAPSDWFPGEGVPSGVPEWDIAASAAGLPIGSLEQDFSVAQTKTGPQIVDSAGNVGTFVNGEFVPETGLTPNLGYATATSAPAPGKAPAPAPAPAAPKGPTLNRALLFGLGALMGQQQQKPQEQTQLARTVPSPFGMDLIL